MSNTITLTIDDRKVTAPEGKKLLWVALENDIYIPNLCAIKEEVRPFASCRLCFVHVEGLPKPVTSCTQAVREGMVVKTRTPQVDRLVRTAFELLLSDHRLHCSTCPQNRSCEMQKIAKERGLQMKLRRYKSLGKEFLLFENSGLFTFDRSRCVLCGRCVWVDHKVAKVGAIGFARRGLERMVTTFGNIDLDPSSCTECGLCVKACPVGALRFTGEQSIEKKG